jgi:hypothetical protein
MGFFEKEKTVLITVDPDEFYSRCMPEPNSGCWIWVHGRSRRNNYPGFYQWRAHRVSWIINKKQQIPKGLFVCHHCDNKLCINPKHLFVGTASDNMIDKVKKGRHIPYRPWLRIYKPEKVE